ncbi:putative coat protein [Ustilaginoidea virens RNA virus 1]|uniref:putative coat protein n=1 Tax=Ustilaginoidea virens RNA virus 1 TaxID=1312445 RepID=UPI0002C69542|nr:putative coat protein [Ustilaginoidea virens RNA virus 1]AGI61064.1 putative coat protein [Ustilaginoidea virens RNA virus 1]
MSALSTFLSGGVVAKGPLKNNEVRRYYTTLISEATLNGVQDVAGKTVVWKVGYAYSGTAGIDYDGVYKIHAEKVRADPKAYPNSKKRNELLKPLIREAYNLKDSEELPIPAALVCPKSVAIRLQTPYPVNEAISAEFANAARRYSGVVGTHGTADFCGIVAQLAKGLAFFASTGGLTMRDLAGGNSYSYMAVGNHTAPLVASTTSIWVPRYAESLMAPNIMAALVAAGSAVGSTIVTDLLPTDVTNTPLLTEANHLELAAGVYHALRVLGTNMEANGAGQLFAYAVTVGIHSVVTVVGMTDEGAYMRDVFRSTSFAPSYGGISTVLPEWHGFPRPADSSLAGWVGLVDSIALGTAASVAIADPCVAIADRYYPTTLTGRYEYGGEPGMGYVGDENDARIISGKIMQLAPSFTRNYFKVLARLFSVTPHENSSVGLTHMIHAFSSETLRDSRHLQHPSVSPFYWVEPTGIITFDTSDFTATAAGFGTLATPSQPGTIPMFERAEVTQNVGDVSDVLVAWRSARTSGLAIHLNNHVEAGMENIRITGCDPNSWAQLGGASQSVSNRVTAGNDLASYMWARSDVGVPAPGEAMYLGEAISLLVRHDTLDGNTWANTPNHVPRDVEFGNNVTIRVGLLAPYGVGPIGPNRKANRAFTAALRALDAARESGMIRAPKLCGTIKLTDQAFGRQAAVPVAIAPPSPKAANRPVTTVSQPPQSDARPVEPQNYAESPTAHVYTQGPKTAPGPAQSVIASVRQMAAEESAETASVAAAPQAGAAQ